MGLSSRAVKPLNLLPSSIMLILSALFGKCKFHMLLGLSLGDVSLTHVVNMDFCKTSGDQTKFWAVWFG